MTDYAPLTVRLTSKDRHFLNKQAQGLGTSPTKLARTIISNAVDEESELAHLRMRITSLENVVTSLREDLAVAVKALLITKGAAPITTAEDAEKWVAMNLECG